MAGKKSQNDDSKIREKDITGLKYFDKLLPILGRLHQVGCERDKAGNRKLHFDQYCSLLLLFLFNPIVRSLRALQQASELKKVQRKLGCARTSLGSLSEATDVFERERLKLFFYSCRAGFAVSRYSMGRIPGWRREHGATRYVEWL